MEKNLEAELAVNNVSMELNAFAEQFLARTVFGAVSSLRGAESIRDLELYLERGEIRAVVNGNEIPITPFPRDIITGTITGMVSSLKGVGKINSVKINLKTR